MARVDLKKKKKRRCYLYFGSIRPILTKQEASLPNVRLIQGKGS